MDEMMKIAAKNRRRAVEIIEEANITGIWKSVGAEANLIGSVKTGLIMKHRDIDFHIYSSPLKVSDSFSAMAKLAENPSVKRIECINLTDTGERCIEWHAWYLDRDGELWQIDMIHILRGSFYDGYMEKVAGRIVEVLTPEMKETILRLKYETPETEKIPGIVYCQAVIRDNVKTYDEFTAWIKNNPVDNIVHWIP